MDDGGTRRSHFEAAQKNGFKVKELEHKDLDPFCYQWWQWFCELNSGRQSNGMGVNVLSWAELKAWTDLTDNHPTPYDIHVLKLIDIEYVNAQQTKKGDKG